jgi:hypothetical protein
MPHGARRLPAITNFATTMYVIIQQPSGSRSADFPKNFHAQFNSNQRGAAMQICMFDPSFHTPIACHITSVENVRCGAAIQWNFTTEFPDFPAWCNTFMSSV